MALAHNGVIENFRDLKERLEAEGYIFRSATDTEVIAHLIASCLEKQTFSAAESRNQRRRRREKWKGRVEIRRQSSAEPADPHEPLIRAVQEALSQLHGTYGLAIIFRDHPDVIIAARLGSPLVVGVGDGEHFVASDASPLVGHTERIVYLADHQMAVVTADSLRVIHRDTRPGYSIGSSRTEVADGRRNSAVTRTTCSRRFSSSPSRSKTPCAAGSICDEATAVFGGLNLIAAAIAAGQSH